MGLDFTVIARNWDYFLWGRTWQGEPGGLLLTVLMAVAAGLLSLGLGLGMALASWLGPRWLRTALTSFADLVRAVPLIFVIFWIFFLVPALFHAELPGAWSVILALAWFSSGAVMHTTLAGLEALPKGHREAGLASGLTELQIFRSLLLPQAMQNLVPSYLALFASMIKDTSLAYIMNVTELTTTASQVNTRVQIHPAEIFLFTAAVYFALCSVLSWAASASSRWTRLARRTRRSSGTSAAASAWIADRSGDRETPPRSKRTGAAFWPRPSA